MNTRTTKRIADLRNNITELQANVPAGAALDAAVAALENTISELAAGTFQELRPIKHAPVVLEIRNASGCRVA